MTYLGVVRGDDGRDGPIVARINRGASMVEVEPTFSNPRAFLRYLDRLPPGFVFETGNSLSTCPLAAWARTFDARAVVSRYHVAWEGSFAAPRVDRLVWWQEVLSRGAMLQALRSGEPIPAADVRVMLQPMLGPGAVRIGRPVRRPEERGR